MALIASLIGLEQLILTQPPKRDIGTATHTCANTNCVTNYETYLTPERETFRGDVELQACAYCGSLLSRCS